MVANDLLSPFLRMQLGSFLSKLSASFYRSFCMHMHLTRKMTTKSLLFHLHKGIRQPPMQLAGSCSQGTSIELLSCLSKGLQCTIVSEGEQRDSGHHRTFITCLLLAPPLASDLFQLLKAHRLSPQVFPPPCGWRLALGVLKADVALWKPAA